MTNNLDLIYHSRPNRGLNILLPVFDRLASRHDIHLEVFSSFKLYGWADADRQFERLLELARSHPRITYHAMVEDHREIHRALANAEIFAYPSIWPENACLCLMESMSAALLCVHSNSGQWEAWLNGIIAAREPKSPG